MDKRYQVFVSSTYSDLKQERQHVIQALMEMDCIPAGMELFPAADEEQWEFIKKVINDCDYYLLIIGGRYGSISDEGISYTEKEFDYAVEKGLKIVALIHGEPGKISFDKSEPNPRIREKLVKFKEKVMTGRLVKFWTETSEIPGLVALSLTKTIKMYPAIGWVRANQVANQDILSELNQVRKENSELQQQISKLEPQEITNIENIADLDSEFKINGTYYTKRPGSPIDTKHTFSSIISWREIFSLISPYLLEHPSDGVVKHKLSSSLLEREGMKGSTISINDQEFKTIGIQLKAYGLISLNYNKTTKGGYALFWGLTKKGEKLMVESRTVK